MDGVRVMSRAALMPVLWLVVSLSGCSDSAEGAGSATLQLGEFCALGFSQDCPGNTCRDAVGGESCDGGTCSDWSQPANQGTICTKSCSGDADCTGISFAGANGEQVSSEQWFCSNGVCNVLVTAPQGQASDVCTGCGGIFCSGRCIGCPSC